MEELQKREFSAGTFNVRGLVDESKKEQLVRDTRRYGIDICAIQETKIETAKELIIDGCKLITFESTVSRYGNGFVVAEKWKDKIQKYWRESDRLCVLQITEENFDCEIIKDLKVKFVRKSQETKQST